MAVCEVCSNASSTEIASLVFTEDEIEALVRKFWVYVAEGFLLAVVNFLICGAILRHQVLRRRKEFIILGGLAFADGANGLATVIGGFARNMLLLAGVGGVRVSRWACLLKPWNLLWLWVEPLCAFMLMVVNLDRLIAVWMPLRHLKFTTRYAWGMLAGAYGWIACCSLFAVFLSYSFDTAEFPQICFNEWSLHPQYYKAMSFFVIFMGIGSVAVYGTAVAIVIIKRSKQRSGSVSSQQTNQHNAGPQNYTQNNEVVRKRKNERKRVARQQRRLTVTMGISCLFTIVFFVVPNLIEFYAAMAELNDIAWLLPYTFIIKNLNQLMNFFIYTIRHNDMRLGVWHMVVCRELTEAKIAVTYERSLQRPSTIQRGGR